MPVIGMRPHPGYPRDKVPRDRVPARGTLGWVALVALLAARAVFDALAKGQIDDNISVARLRLAPDVKSDSQQEDEG